MFACCLLFSQSKLCHIIKAAIIILIMYTVQLSAEGGTRIGSDVCNSLFQSHRDEASFQSPAFRFLCFRHKTISGLQITPRQSHRSQVNQLSFINFPGHKIVLLKALHGTNISYSSEILRMFCSCIPIIS